MGHQTASPAWLVAEREFEDDLGEFETVPQLYEHSAEANVQETAQLYKGGVYRRSLVAEDVIPAAESGAFASLTYGEMREVVRRLAAGFRELGVEPDDRVGILASTRLEWAQSDLALLAAGAVVTTVYTESSPNQVRYLLDDPEASGVVVENEELLGRVLEVEDDLEFAVVMDEVRTHGDRDDVYTLGEVYGLGRDVFDLDAYRTWVDERSTDDLASLIYTSGTTGQPKGVMLSHGNFRANVRQTRRRFGPRPDKGPEVPVIDGDSVAISFLPLAHVFERLSGHFLMFSMGATVGYAESPDTLAEDFEKIRPTTGGSVPRVYERLFEAIRQEASESAVKERIFTWAMDVAVEWEETRNPGPILHAKYAVADRLVYSTIKERLGGNVEMLVSGGGSLDVRLCKTFNGMGITVLEGYGLTETSPVVTSNPPEDIRPGTIGYPLVGVEIKLDESVVSEGQFADATGTVGELLIKGDNVTEGYWDRPGETMEAFTDDGWFRSGDIVEETYDGYLRFRERVKQIIVLSTGKNVAPGPIEDRFATNERVDQAMVIGDGEKFIAALLVPNFEKLSQWAENEGIDLPTDDEAKCQDDRVREWAGKAVDDVNADLEKVERIKRFELVSREWTAENDLLTPSMKKKRRNITEAFREKVDAIYADEPPEVEADA